MPPERKEDITSVTRLLQLGLEDPLGHAIHTTQYLTSWVLALVAFHPWTHTHVNLLFLTGFVFILSMYISFIKPGYFAYRYKGKTYLAKGGAKLFLDATMHIAPLAMVLWLYGGYYLHPEVVFSLATSNSLLVLFLYTISADFPSLYEVSPHAVVVLTLLFLGAYMALSVGLCSR